MPSRPLIKPLGISASTVVHPSGHGIDALWDAVVHNRSGLRSNELGWCDLPCAVGVVPDLDDPSIGRLLGDWDCRNHRLAWLALQDRAFQRGVALARSRYGADRIAVIVGTSTSGIGGTEMAYARRHMDGQWPPHFNYRHVHAVDALPRFSAKQLQLEGPLLAVSTACSSSAKVFLLAQRWIAAGIADAAIVGGVDSLCLSTLHGFDALQLLSQNVCRPFDLNRDGISIGEAAGFMLLEQHPAPVHLSGGGESSDAWHMSTPHPLGEGAQAAMLAALDQAGLTSSDIGWVNAHGTGTPANDRSEAAALNSVFGPHGVPVSSTKGITGHTLAAAGIVEAAICASAVQHRLLPPSANLRNHDTSLHLDVLDRARQTDSRHVMSNSFGFGGSNAALIFSEGG
ncbi:beta-ketoacyl-ACP synthase [Ottowia sp.]|uniref:beta-ketoacyl-ACP synthase n=1 Tax=Ottowia sp. TaxID=1898956 RepID=UPI002C520D11|nr:beta-ketoacyl-ACP synthase [Ottowia sp.]HRN77123.1 beta-ketoacyl-ACP synthase [Ottowia sp.]